MMSVTSVNAFLTTGQKIELFTAAALIPANLVDINMKNSNASKKSQARIKAITSFVHVSNAVISTYNNANQGARKHSLFRAMVHGYALCKNVYDFCTLKESVEEVAENKTIEEPHDYKNNNHVAIASVDLVFALAQMSHMFYKKELVDGFTGEFAKTVDASPILSSLLSLVTCVRKGYLHEGSKGKNAWYAAAGLYGLFSLREFYVYKNTTCLNVRKELEAEAAQEEKRWQEEYQKRLEEQRQRRIRQEAQEQEKRHQDAEQRRCQQELYQRRQEAQEQARRRQEAQELRRQEAQEQERRRQEEAQVRRINEFLRVFYERVSQHQRDQQIETARLRNQAELQRNPQARARQQAFLAQPIDLNDKCTICLETFAESQEMPIQRIRPCGHALHAGCLQQLQASSARGLCPQCRWPIH